MRSISPHFVERNQTCNSASSACHLSGPSLGVAHEVEDRRQVHYVSDQVEPQAQVLTSELLELLFLVQLVFALARREVRDLG